MRATLLAATLGFAAVAYTVPVPILASTAPPVTEVRTIAKSPFQVFIGTATSNMANLLSASNVAQQLASGRIGLYMHNSGMSTLTAAQIASIPSVWGATGITGQPGSGGVGEISQFVAQITANSESPHFPGGVFPAEVDIDVTPTGSYTTAIARGDTTSGVTYPGYYQPSDVTAIENSIKYSAVDGVKNAAPFVTPNSERQDLVDPFATSAYWAPVRAICLYAGGIAIDTPPTFWIGVASSAYRSIIEQQIAWAKVNHLRISFVVSPYPSSPSVTDTEFLAHTETLVGQLKAFGDLPTEWVVENYQNPTNGTNDATSDSGIKNSLYQVALYLARSGPLSAPATATPQFPGGLPQASLNSPGTKLQQGIPSRLRQGAQQLPNDDASYALLGGQQGDVGIGFDNVAGAMLANIFSEKTVGAISGALITGTIGTIGDLAGDAAHG